MPDVVTFGEVMAMFVAAQPGPLDEAEHFGVRLSGAEMNVAVGLSRLGHAVGYLGAVGDDPLGVRVRRELVAEGVDTGHLVTDPGAPTGFQLKSRVLSGDPTVVYFRRGSAASRLRWSGEAEKTVRSARHLHVTGIFPALTPHTRDFTFRAVEAARESGATVSFDPNLRPVLWADENDMVDTINRLAALADTVLPGRSEGTRLTGHENPRAIADFYLNRGAREVVVKLGSDGAAAYYRTGTVWEPAFPVRVVDTVGAGDGFAAGWISARLDGLDERAALRRACVVGALATTSEGDKDGLPTRVELGELLDDAA
ncbi:sugar kinase [Amycolatopsis taiwanensis]|uniref:Sugar kinase n=1 Tax=Amycolatopsis taiwanensis TaxID=342230 RepID=A0A9W6VFV1_9PSEU|nr:sugar kinase [Amycolatopsis taiwanensis]GLY64866.1 sugar kinase [Amycolatopsis taiwanensis]